MISFYLHSDSVAFNALIPGSADLNSLNSFPGNLIIPFNATSLPSGVRYVSVVATWGNRNTLTQTKPSLAWTDGGDGIVTETSQDLSKIPGFTSLPVSVQTNHTVVPVVFNDDPGPGCGNQVTEPYPINEVHTCETRNAKTLGKILFPHILPAGNVTVSTGAPSTTQATTQVAIRGEVAVQTPLTNVIFKYGTTASSLNLTVAPTQPLTTSSSTTQFSANLPATLLPGATYFYQLVAETGGGTATGGQTVVGQVHQVTIPPATGIGALLAAPTGLSPTSGTANQPLTPTLTWNTVTGATSYRIMVAQDVSALPTDPTDGNCDRCLLDIVPNAATPTTYTPPAGLLTSGTTYYWQVHARSPVNFGAWTAPTSITTQSAIPTTLLSAPVQTAPANGDTGQTTMPTLSWTPVTGATSYRIMIATTAAALTTDPTSADCPSCVTNAVVPGAQGTTYIPSIGLLAVGSIYYWSVKTRSPDSYGSWSVVRSFTPVAQAQIVTTFSAGAAAGASVNSLTAGPDGNIWFAERVGNRIGRITPAGVVTEFSAGISTGANPWSITAGPDGNLWFTEGSNNRIGRITPTGAVTEFSVGITPGAYPGLITGGPDGNIWFIESTGIGRITPTGVVTEFSAGISSYRISAITAGPDGNLWFTEQLANQIGRITPSGVVTEFSVGITPRAYPFDITAGPDGNLWFTEPSIYRIGRITPTGVVTEFNAGISATAVPPICSFVCVSNSAGALPTVIRAGPDGNLWFTDGYDYGIGRITPTGVVTKFGVSSIYPYNMTVGPDGNIWFQVSGANQIGRITIGGGSGPANPADCLFNWAERSYATLFAPPAATSITLAPYYYRYYSQTSAYLATSSADNHLYYLGPISNSSILDLGALSTWLTTASCH